MIETINKTAIGYIAWINWKNMLKRVLLFLVLLFSSFSLSAQNSLSKTRWYHPSEDKTLWTLKKNRIKFTLKPVGFNNNYLKKAETDLECLDYVYKIDVTGIIKYDARVKFYINDGIRLIFRTQFSGIKTSIYTAGFAVRLRTIFKNYQT
jgi:hypothetical protein